MESGVPSCPVPCQPLHQGQTRKLLSVSNLCSQHTVTRLWLLKALSCVLVSKTLTPASDISFRAGGDHLSPCFLLDLKGTQKPRSQGLSGRVGLGRHDTWRGGLSCPLRWARGPSLFLWCRDFSTLHGDRDTSLVDPIFIDNYLSFLSFLHSISHLTAR